MFLTVPKKFCWKRWPNAGSWTTVSSGYNFCYLNVFWNKCLKTNNSLFSPKHQSSMADVSHGNMPAIYTLLLGARPPIGQYPSRAPVLFFFSFERKISAIVGKSEHSWKHFYYQSVSRDANKATKINCIKHPTLEIVQKNPKTYVRVLFQKCDITGLVTSHDHSRTF